MRDERVARRGGMDIKPAYLVFAALAGTFGTLLYLEGWVFPLKLVAAMLPLAGYILFT